MKFICRDYSLDLGARTYIMGILNLTPDSFSGDGIYGISASLRAKRSNPVGRDYVIDYAQRMVDEGADIIDVGGESTRPGAGEVTVEEERHRVIPVIKRLAKKLKVPISIDTTKYEIAKEALEAGAAIVNDITGLRGAPQIAGLAAKFKAGIVLMHIKGTPRTMQKRPRYRSLIEDILGSLKKSVEIAREAGIRKSSIAVDPGIGFGKTIHHNLRILKFLGKFRVFGYPLLIGLSRKSFIGNVLDIPVEERLMGTAACIALAVANGTNIVRVHDVKEMVQVARMVDAVVR